MLFTRSNKRIVWLDRNKWFFKRRINVRIVLFKWVSVTSVRVWCIVCNAPCMVGILLGIAVKLSHHLLRSLLLSDQCNEYASMTILPKSIEYTHLHFQLWLNREQCTQRWQEHFHCNAIDGNVHWLLSLRNSNSTRCYRINPHTHAHNLSTQWYSLRAFYKICYMKVVAIDCSIYY